MNVQPPKLTLFCLPCAGASATMYLRWGRLLPAWIQLLPLELPGRGARLGEPFVENFQVLVSQLCDDVLHRAADRWALFGHSMGALLAFGIASRLQAMQGPMPAMLFASGSPAPSRRDWGRFPDTDDDAALIADLRKQGGTPQEVFDSPELLRLTLDVLRADYRVCRSFDYRQGGRLTIPVRVFAGRHDDIEPSRIESWRMEAGEGFALHWFDGGHFFIRQQEPQVLRALEHSLRQAPMESHRVGVAPA